MYRRASIFLRPLSYRLSFFLSGLAIFIGGLIYLLLRPSEYIFFEWLGRAGLEHWIGPARAVSPLLGQLFPNWIIFSLPNGLWAFAYALVITRMWSGSRSWLKYFWMASIPLLVLGFELLQLPGVIPGTFCIQDMVFGLLGLILGIFIGTIKTINNNYHEKAFE